MIEYSKATLDWIKAGEERELESQQQSLKRKSRTEGDYLKFLDILEENIEGFYFTTTSGSSYGESCEFYSGWYEDYNGREIYNSSDNFDNDFTTAKELVEDICQHLRIKE